MLWFVFFLVFGIQIVLTLPRFLKTCGSKTLYTWSLYIFHHLFDVFLFWSFLFLTTQLDFGLHLLILLGVVVHWLTYDNKCIITVLMNHECGYPEDQWLDSLKNMLGIRNINEYFHFIWMALLAFQDIYKINLI
jgi:hypothetical protein